MTAGALRRGWILMPPKPQILLLPNWNLQPGVAQGSVLFARCFFITRALPSLFEARNKVHVSCQQQHGRESSFGFAFRTSVGQHQTGYRDAVLDMSNLHDDAPILPAPKPQGPQAGSQQTMAPLASPLGWCPTKLGLSLSSLNLFLVLLR